MHGSVEGDEILQYEHVRDSGQERQGLETHRCFLRQLALSTHILSFRAACTRPSRHAVRTPHASVPLAYLILPHKTLSLC